ncbi:MAG TPA: hypothetical protein VFZ27_10950 [Terriglobia bacterium]|nr:hypothetical protein [Terriglobia bacterium]
MITRKILKVTWTKDPQQAPFPGVYAAVDISARYQKADRFCGYLVLYQHRSGGDFEVMREEQNFIDNTTAEKMEEQQSRIALDQAWAALAVNCPNYEPDVP